MFNLEDAMKIQTGGAEVYLYSFFNFGVRCGGCQRHFPVPMVQEAGWGPGPVRTSAKTSPTSGLDHQTVYPIASRYTDRAIAAHTIQIEFHFFKEIY